MGQRMRGKGGDVVRKNSHSTRMPRRGSVGVGKGLQRLHEFVAFLLLQMHMSAPSNS